MTHAQGRSAPEWTTQAADAQRSSWIATDPWLSLDSMKDFKFLWKITLDNDARQANALTSPVALANIFSFRGFKSLIFVGGSANNVYAIDYDFGTLFWKTHFNYSSGVPEYAGSPACPGGMTAPVTRPTSLIASSQLSFMGFARAPRPAKSEVGEPGKGAPAREPPPAAVAAPAAPAAPAPGSAAVPPPVAAPTPGRGRGPLAVFAVGGDGIVRTLNPHNGDAVAPPVRLLPPNSTGSGLIEAEDMVYAVTSNGCGGAPDAVWAMDWSKDEKPVVSWKSNGAPIGDPALGVDGTVYVATGGGTSAYANSVVALEGKTLRLKDWFTMPAGTSGAAGTPGASLPARSPVMFSEGTRNYLAVAGMDGRVYLLDAAALGGADHKTALMASPASAQSGFDGLSTWKDARGVRWILAAAHAASGSGAIVAFRMTPGTGSVALEQAWVSRELISPRSAMIINGVVFALSGGTSAAPAVLYALHPDTGREIWNSGNTITSFATGGLSAGTGQVYVVTHDNTVWTFGIPQAN